MKNEMLFTTLGLYFNYFFLLLPKWQGIWTNWLSEERGVGSRKELLDSISWVWEIFREPKALSSGVIILKQWETVCWILTNKEALS